METQHQILKKSIAIAKATKVLLIILVLIQLVELVMLLAKKGYIHL